MTRVSTQRDAKVRRMARPAAPHVAAHREHDGRDDCTRGTRASGVKSGGRKGDVRIAPADATRWRGARRLREAGCGEKRAAERCCRPRRGSGGRMVGRGREAATGRRRRGWAAPHEGGHSAAHRSRVGSMACDKIGVHAKNVVGVCGSSSAGEGTEGGRKAGEVGWRREHEVDGCAQATTGCDWKPAAHSGTRKLQVRPSPMPCVGGRSG